ncbi:rrna primary transcript binding protein [Lentinula edodes]|uniref:Rrna primary transcript binding protein n=1 Tax=Lentinula edodes TaxID=5353 RepID=A0A1Q3EC53_LENED|nr:rrna primary transcript binding protein [Lentinula edodes]
MPEEHDRASHREDRHRSSKHEERDGHREREHRDRGDRSDRYGGRRGDDRRDGRGDRDRERYSRGPREFDERRPRDDDRRRGREDDGYGPPRDRGDRGERRGRGGGGGGEGRGGGGGGGGGGRREATPPERRSPTPEGAVPLTQRRRKASGWDVHAPGYEQYSAMQAKQTGLFNLPGANRTQIPPILGIAGLPPPMPVQTFGMGIGANPNLSRQSRRLYIGSITPEVNEQNLAEFFNQKMAEMNIGTSTPGPPVLAVQCNYEKNYAFFRSAEDATSAMAFDGIIFINGPLKIRRPKDYGGVEIPAAAPVVHVPGVVSTNVPDSINKVFSFGELKAFNLGFAFFEYVDASVTDTAIQALNGMELGDRYLVVQRASVGAKPDTPGMIPNLPYDQFPEIPRPIMPAGESTGSDARILLMLNMVTPEDLIDDEEYGDLFDDIKEECSNFGAVEDLRIPRPVKKDKTKWTPGEGLDPQAIARIDEAAGVGRVYVKYVDSHSASAALKSLAGRSFAGRSIIATLLSEESQTTPPLNLIFAPQPDAPPPLPADS